MSFFNNSILFASRSIAHGKDAVILIKSLDTAKYKNLVDMLDEMHITNQKIYAIVDIYDLEKAVLQRDFPGSI